MRTPRRLAKQDSAASSPRQTDFFEAKATGEPLLVPIALLDEDGNNPRTEFPDADLDELAEDIRQHGGMNLTSVAHHLSLLDLPPELEQALKEGRCMSPRTLHELSKLHHEEPERVRALVAGDAEITRTAVTAMRANVASTSSASLLAQANAACARFERTLARLNKAGHEGDDVDLVALRQRIADLASRLT